MSLAAFHLLVLILTANGAPILARKLLATRFEYPLDFGLYLHHHRVLGAHKTWRGVVASIVLTSLLAMLLGYDWQTGALIGCWAMAGDILSSFIKRRLDLKPSNMAPFVDQIPESLLPAWVLRDVFGLEPTGVIILVCSFIVLELILSKILYRLGIRRTPY